MTIAAGQILMARSVCDTGCVFTLNVLARKGAWATIRTMGAERRVKIHADDEGREFIYGHGRFSMAPVFRAPLEVKP